MAWCSDWRPCYATGRNGVATRQPASRLPRSTFQAHGCRQLRCRQSLTGIPLHLAKRLAAVPLFHVAIDFFLAATDKVPPQQDILGKGFAADQQKLGGTRETQ